MPIAILIHPQVFAQQGKKQPKLTKFHQKKGLSYCHCRDRAICQNVFAAAHLLHLTQDAAAAPGATSKAVGSAICTN